MSDRIKVMIPYVAMWGIFFYLVPNIIGESAIFSIYIRFILTWLCFLSGLVLTIDDDFYWYYALVVAGMFLLAYIFTGGVFGIGYLFLYSFAALGGGIAGLVIELFKQ